MDDRDRKREKEELEEIRQRLLAEGHPDPDAELQRVSTYPVSVWGSPQLLSFSVSFCLIYHPISSLQMEQEAERRRQPPVKQEPESEEEAEEDKGQKEEREKRGGGVAGPDIVEPDPQSEDEAEEGEEEDDEVPDTKPCLKPTLRPITAAPSVSSASGNASPNTPGDDSPCGIIIPHENSPEAPPPEELRPKIGLSLRLGKSRSIKELPNFDSRVTLYFLGFISALNVRVLPVLD